LNRSGRRGREESEFTEQVVTINRVAKVVKGGRRFHFSALVVVGDGKGRVGVHLGKANEVADAVRKGTEGARKRMITVPIENGTIPCEVEGHFGSGRVLLKPASAGTGVIAGGGVRAVMTAAGVSDVLTKSMGTSNAINVVHATMEAFTKLNDIIEVSRFRRKVADGSA